jgi:hypothetical protein
MADRFSHYLKVKKAGPLIEKDGIFLGSGRIKEYSLDIQTGLKKIELKDNPIYYVLNKDFFIEER